MSGWMKAITSQRDRAYCRGCMYEAPVMLREDFLCDHLSITGKLRGCPPGVGCTARKYPGELVKKEKLRVCDTCGVRYEGGKHSRLCPDCRTAIRRQTALNMVAKREKKTP